MFREGAVLLALAYGIVVTGSISFATDPCDGMKPNTKVACLDPVPKCQDLNKITNPPTSAQCLAYTAYDSAANLATACIGPGAPTTLCQMKDLQCAQQWDCEPSPVNGFCFPKGPTKTSDTPPLDVWLLKNRATYQSCVSRGTTFDVPSVIDDTQVPVGP